MTYANRIVTLWKAGISPSFLEKKQKEAPVFFDPLLTAISHIQALPGKYTLLATGTSGTILMNHQSKLVRKFANLDDMINEYKLLDKIYLHHKDHTPNIIVHHINTQLAVPKRETCESLCKLYPAQVFIDFDYINGQTVYQAMRQNVIGDADACAYGKDILNGLSAMKAAGIPYHNDLGPHNVMLDYDKHRAIIIDLGVAGKKKDPTRIYNVRFGGDNDLVSLGQMMYYMATGKHIFLNSPVKNIDLSDVVKEIGANRDAAYSDATGKVLEDYFTRVDSDIKDSSLSGIIKACLKAGPDDHDKIMKMFEDYKK
jgi:serine/threonine protein kinase